MQRAVTDLVLVPNPDEVASTHWLPLSSLMTAQIAPSIVPSLPASVQVPAITVIPLCIWGLTLRQLALLSAALGAPTLLAALPDSSPLLVQRIIAALAKL